MSRSYSKQTRGDRVCFLAGLVLFLPASLSTYDWDLVHYGGATVQEDNTILGSFVYEF